MYELKKMFFNKLKIIPVCGTCGTGKIERNLRECQAYEKTDVVNISIKRSFMGMYTKSSWPPITLEVYKSTSENDQREEEDKTSKNKCFAFKFIRNEINT